MEVTGDHFVGQEKEVFQDGGRYWILLRGQEREEQTYIWLLDLVRWTSLITLVIVVSITIERQKNPDWSKLRKENEAKNESNHIRNSFKKQKRNSQCRGMWIQWLEILEEVCMPIPHPVGRNWCCRTERDISSMRKWEDKRARAQMKGLDFDESGNTLFVVTAKKKENGLGR